MQRQNPTGYGLSTRGYKSTTPSVMKHVFMLTIVSYLNPDYYRILTNMENEPKLFATRGSVNISEREEILNNRANIIREQWIKLMETRILREKLEECYLREGVNHQENCRVLSLRYLDQFPKTRVTGWRKIDDPFEKK
ncbi:NADH-ubiquinone oxidoreductase 12 kDa subunit, mitochondrial [Zancudomyces culisetae]|uniref:NADH-ubiquinone oxidoreductase 12 kDa subunit, mitochondrial n=1 Tax=Zancudomyces culisetae TaxID=1213189 RepID=A0A1R1PJ23_ZANCU|nr:NADH-ubiquinone oxidoreductase 12 kDa subunit, mitochondrial [Zancudomyces culisetae]|eukprot:OMH80948.1 NADH-ubiquinone oxidoreductase 12 kDa subunit, mitochondrial [Zancudomyces culisetae]